VDTFGYVAVALAVGAALGAGLVLVARRGSGTGIQAARLEARLEVQAAEMRRLADVAIVQGDGDERLRREVAGARAALEQLALREEGRQDRERESWEVVRRLSTVLAGGAAKGRAGENVLREHLSQLPPGMLVTDLRVNGRVVEFGLELPDGRRLPIDSKWTALAELEALEACQDPAERELRAREVERRVAERAREVACYLDPAITAPVAVAAIPDAAFSVLRRAHADAFARGVVIVPYSTALPVLLFLYSLVHRFGDADGARAALEEVASLLELMEGVVENKLARAATMATNAADEFRSAIGKARGSVARGRVASHPDREIVRAERSEALVRG
jgi:hypothetical protein